jgi:hypothetical protein
MIFSSWRCEGSQNKQGAKLPVKDLENQQNFLAPMLRPSVSSMADSILEICIVDVGNKALPHLKRFLIKTQLKFNNSYKCAFA